MPQSNPALVKPWQYLPRTPKLPPPENGDGKGEYCESNGAKIWYATYGRGAPVILLHGGLSNSNYNAHQIVALQRNHQVIIIDSRGHGRSTYDPKQKFSYDLMASDVVGVMDHLRIQRAAIVGWSDGGIIGLKMAINYPDRISSLVASGVNATSDGVDEEAFAADPVGDHYFKRTAKERTRLSPEPLQGKHFAAAIIDMWSREPNISDSDLCKIKTPTLISHGAHDLWVKKDQARRIAELIPGAIFDEIEKTNHFSFLQDPNAFNGKMRTFLAQHQKPQTSPKSHPYNPA